MSSIASIAPASSQNGSTDDAAASLGLPPVILAQAASTNTINAELVVSGLGVDPGAVAGVYGGSGAPSSNWFSNAELLPALSNLSRGTAEQALALYGVPTSAPAADASTAADATPAAQAAQAAFDPASNTAIPPSDTLGVAVVDPLWGKNA
jgi:hypothetical protein